METKKTKILIVDDEPEIVSTLKHCLMLRGYQAEGALNCEEALRCLEEQAADLILLDIMMPGIKGTEFAKIVKEKYPATKIVIITAFPTETENLSKAKLTEALFVKPVELKELYATLKTLEEKIREEVKVTVLYFKTRLLMTMMNMLEQDYRNN